MLSLRVLIMTSLLPLSGAHAAAPVQPPGRETVAGLPAYELDPLKPESTVLGITQTTDGYLWFGTPGGVSRFDGVAAENFAPGFVPELVPSGPTALAGTANGDLWVGFGRDPGSPAGLVRFHRGRWSRVEWEGTTAGVSTLLPDGAQGLWVGTMNGLYRGSPAEGDAYRIAPIGPIRVPVLAMTPAEHGGDYWLGTPSGVSLLRGSTVIQGPSSLGPVVTMASAQGNKMWVGGPGGLHLVGWPDDDQQGARVEVLPLPSFAASLAHADVRQLASDGKGGAWIGTSNGVCHLTTSAIQTFGRGDGLSDENILALLRDREDTLWLGTRAGGVTRLRRRRLWNFDTRDGLPGRAAHAALQAPDGSVWISMSDGLAHFIDGRFATYRAGQEFPARSPRSLAMTRDGALWIATDGDGLVRFDGDGFRVFGSAQGLPDLHVRTIVADADSDVWVGGSAGGLVRLRGSSGQAIRTYGPGDGLCPGVITAGTPRAAGGLWLVTSEGGLIRYDGERFTCSRPRQGLPVRPASSVTEDSAGTLWIGFLFDGGLARVRQGQSRVFTQRDGLFCDSISQVVDDGRGHLWTACGGGVARVVKSQLDDPQGAANVRPLFFQAQEGMHAQECSRDAGPAATLGPGGTIWFATLLGVTVVLDPDQLPQRPAPVPFLKALSVDGRAVNPAWPVTARTSNAALAIDVTAPTFLNPARVEFRYRLEPLQTQWDVAATRQVFLPHVPPGEYKLLLEAADPLHGWTPALTPVSLSLVPPFVETWLFFALCAAVLLGLLWGAHRLRLRQLAARYEAVATERARIARDLHDGLGQGFTAVGMHLEALSQSLPQAPPKVRGLLERTIEVLDHAHEEARRSIWNLRAQTLGRTSLAALIAKVTEQHRASMPDNGPRLRLSLELPGDHREDEESEIVRHELPLIAQEAITNAVRHAQAHIVQVTLGATADTVWLSVKDDGKGLATDEPSTLAAGTKGHFGILGMRERARRAGGQLVVTSPPGGGTEVRIEIASPKKESSS